jgi:hypothetical protein
MNFEYRLNIEDLKEGYRANLPGLGKYTFIIGGIVILVDSFPLLLKGTISFQKIISGVITPSLLILAFFYFFRFYQSYSLKKMLNLPEVNGDVIVETSDEGLTITTVTSESKTKWNMYGYWKETSNLFLLYYQVNVLLNIFPKRAFIDDEQIHEFRELLRVNLSTQPNRR